MPTERIAMRLVREMLRLTRDGGLPGREVARRIGGVALDGARCYRPERNGGWVSFVRTRSLEGIARL